MAACCWSFARKCFPFAFPALFWRDWREAPSSKVTYSRTARHGPLEQPSELGLRRAPIGP